MSCDPPSLYSILSKHYFVSTYAIRGCADNSRNEFFNLNLKFLSDHQDPEPGFLKLAKIAHSFNNLSKMSSYIVNGMILGDKSWFFPVKFFFGENPASIFQYSYRQDHAILVAVNIFPKGKPTALWLTDDGSVVCYGILLVRIYLIYLFVLILSYMIYLTCRWKTAPIDCLFFYWSEET